ncbi:Ig-like domain-containing protein [Natronoflexus pectinivorans]|uniref:Carboxypeptidase family protein n=1 Tax=Natronoflexus pectinivorans TaxID=682526 RepID=A0A4R2GI84_9BACT|nr:Ig-like domain-containing protein [Natronoflexus pectinivorans]TCO07901.1 carboxypeptidase family protein [Natronoflexus pectinivorans]
MLKHGIDFLYRNIIAGIISKYRVPFALLVVFILIVFLPGGCASTGMPTGGPRDEDPPVMVRSFPPENSLSFTGRNIRIEFDELIQVTDIFQKLMVSPPVNQQPTVTARANALVIEFNEDLQPNTTYTLDFADAVRDNNEGNILHDFRFSFSTGEIIDSLKISGHLFDATNYEPVSGALVMVHSNHADSAFRKLVPIRVTKTNPDGRFTIQNLAPGEYRLFALEDANRNFRYDQPGERIAFYSDIIVPYIGYHEVIDSISSDSAIVVKQEAYLPDSLQLFLFQEDNIPQYLRDYERRARNRIDFVFGRTLLEPVKVGLVNRQAEDWFLYEHTAAHDSVYLWLKDTTLINSDTLRLSLEYPMLDSLREVTWKKDTINLYYFETGGGQGRRRRGDDEPPPTPVLRHEGLKANLDILEELSLRFPTPLKNIDYTGLRMFEMVDTIPKAMEFDLRQDSVRIRRYVFEFNREAGGRYVLEADSAAFTDIYGVSTNAFRQEFSVRKEDDYGIFYVEIESPESTWLIQLMNRQERVIRQAPVPRNGRIAFRYLRPGEYMLRIVDDKNGNGKWDTGDLEKEIQPERLFYYPEVLNVRANWSIHVPWNPHEFDIHEFVKTHRQRTGSQRQRR